MEHPSVHAVWLSAGAQALARAMACGYGAAVSMAAVDASQLCHAGDSEDNQQAADGDDTNDLHWSADLCVDADGNDDRDFQRRGQSRNRRSSAQRWGCSAERRGCILLCLPMRYVRFSER